MDLQVPANAVVKFPSLCDQKRVSPSSSYAHLPHLPLDPLSSTIEEDDLNGADDDDDNNMAGPTRTHDFDMASASTSGVLNDLNIKIPRPPNPWILYRADKARELVNSKLTQAEVSRLIAQMWRNETPEVRAHYERLAEIKKEEHRRRYPGYRFQPLKKEEKERQREEKRQEKERARGQKRRPRAAPYATPSYPTPMAVPPPPGPYPAVPFYYSAGYSPYAPQGPSPPLSAASSPDDSTPYPSSESSPEQVTDASAPPPPQQDVYAAPQPVPALPMRFPDYIPMSPADSEHLWNGYSQPQQRQLSGASRNGATPAAVWDDFNLDPALAGEGSHPQTPSVNGSGSSQVEPEHLQFNLPDQPWMQGEEQDTAALKTYHEGMQASLRSTGHDSVFGLQQFDANSLFRNPSGEIEVEDNFGSFDFASFDQFASTSQHTLDDGILPAETTIDFGLLFDSPSGVQHRNSSGSASTSSNRDFSYNPDDFLNFDGGIAPNATLVSGQQVPQTQYQPSADQHRVVDATNTTPPHASPGPYVPPAGAAHSSSRRVGASWKPNFQALEDEKRAEHNSHNSW